MHDRLGRIYAPDERDENYLLRSIIPEVARAEPTRTYRYWYNRFNEDQTGPSCVANTGAHLHGNSPKPTYTLAQLDALVPANYVSYCGERGFRGYLYDNAQLRDEFSSTPPAGGTSWRGAAKVLVELGLIESYWWLTNEEEILTAILEVGPVALGCWWREGMFARPGELLQLTGDYVGGHEVCLDGANRKKGIVRVQTWGVHYKLRVSDLAQLMAEEGDASVVLEPKAAQRLSNDLEVI